MIGLILANRKMVVIVGAILLIGLVVLWLRADAVRDFTKKLQIKASEGIEKARGIENEVRNLDDDDKSNCLRDASKC